MTRYFKHLTVAGLWVCFCLYAGMAHTKAQSVRLHTERVEKQDSSKEASYDVVVKIANAPVVLKKIKKGYHAPIRLHLKVKKGQQTEEFRKTYSTEEALYADSTLYAFGEAHGLEEDWLRAPSGLDSLSLHELHGEVHENAHHHHRLRPGTPPIGCYFPLTEDGFEWEEALEERIEAEVEHELEHVIAQLEKQIERLERKRRRLKKQLKE